MHFYADKEVPDPIDVCLLTNGYFDSYSEDSLLLDLKTEQKFSSKLGTFFCGIKKQLHALLGISLTSLVTTNKLNSVQLCDKAPLKAVSATIFAASASS